MREYYIDINDPDYIGIISATFLYYKNKLHICSFRDRHAHELNVDKARAYVESMNNAIDFSNIDIFSHHIAGKSKDGDVFNGLLLIRKNGKCDISVNSIIQLEDEGYGLQKTVFDILLVN